MKTLVPNLRPFELGHAVCSSVCGSLAQVIECEYKQAGELEGERFPTRVVLQPV
jgi:hypothetical protein